MKSRLGFLLLMMVFVMACGREGEDGGQKGDTQGNASRTVRVTMRDDFSYEPKRIEVAGGETIRFVVFNAGSNRHEFLMGDANKQEEYEREMREGGHEKHGRDTSGVNVEPGAEKSFVFTVPGGERKLLFGCHEPGHYQAGMRGEFVYTRSEPEAGKAEHESSPESEVHH